MSRSEPQAGLSDLLGRQRGWVAAWVGLVVAGSVLGVWLLPAEWMLLRRLAAGAVGGAGVALIVSATRLIG